MRPEILQEYILSGIRKEVSDSKIELYVPFHFPNGDNTPLCLTWDETGVLSDGGRTLAELKKRVGDLTPYMEKIRRVCNPFCPVELISGHILAVRQFQTVVTPDGEYKDYCAGLSRLLDAAARISVLDVIDITESGEVSL